MEKTFLKKIIVESQEFILNEKVIKRHYTIEKNGNYVFVGQRRAGKTYLMFQQIKELIKNNSITIEHILYINFEDERFIEFQNTDFNVLIEAYKELFTHKPICFFDEIQNISGWEKFVRRLADQKYQVFVTGSNAKMLSKEIATILGGRFIIKEIQGLSFQEFLMFNNVKPENNYELKEQRFEIQRLFKEYLFYGSLPETLKFNNKKEYLSNLFQKIFYGDIIARYKIKNDFGLKLLVKKIAESTMDETSFNRIKNIIKSAGISVGTKTLIDYFGYLNDAYLIFSINNFNSKFVERETKKKFYFSDTGILNLFLFNPESKLLETFVYNRLRKLFDTEVYYFRENTEVDFYIPDKELIQVVYSINNYQTREREINALIKAETKVRAKNLKIITYDEQEQISYKGKTIKVIPAWKWALSDKQ
jgi:predicted AAA+ superfamily ATPase